MAQGLTISELLALRGFDATRPVKIVRHQDSRYDMDEVRRAGWLETYQSYQRRPVLDHCESLISCVGTGGTTARFMGVYRVGARKAASEVPLPDGCPYATFRHPQGYWYDLVREPGYEDLEGRVIIDWGRSARQWVQRKVDKAVLEIQPPGRVQPPFRDYLEFVLSYDELVELVRHGDTNREWRARLSAVAGVYLIVATTTGAQYVGSASGEAGIWGRWMTYAQDGHGSNKLLQELLKQDSAYPRAFQYSILQILPKTQGPAEVLAWERRYKNKLGIRAVSLNAN